MWNAYELDWTNVQHLNLDNANLLILNMIRNEMDETILFICAREYQLLNHISHIENYLVRSQLNDVSESASVWGSRIADTFLITSM